ncbi:MraY family glycosyltransferase [Rhodocista pekingensis]|uniref:Glycosyltransferase family 4 protein n=1 Tax=Rhodocista pekingensis TaxID=201185 RepID=A0ABW2KT52_9PROT
MQTSAWLYPAALLLPWLAARVLTGRVTAELRRRQVLDRPNHRSSHTLPTPRGGGWGVLPVVWAAWALLGWQAGALAGTGPVLAASALLALVSWADDMRPVPPLPRLAAQALAVTAGLLALPGDALLFQGLLPLPADRLLAALGWLWFVNLYNFMDGIDGITGSQTLFLGAGVALLLLLAGQPGPEAAYGLALAGAAAGFLAWNWRPARVFLGDVGSVPLGYLTGWLLLTAAAEGLWLPAAILPLYYLADATLTLLRRLLRGERVWQPHREHFYQRAVDRLCRHDRVVLAILAADAVLLAVAAATLSRPWAALAAPLAVLALLAWMARGPLHARVAENSRGLPR